MHFYLCFSFHYGTEQNYKNNDFQTGFLNSACQLLFNRHVVLPQVHTTGWINKYFYMEFQQNIAYSWVILRLSFHVCMTHMDNQIFCACHLLCFEACAQRQGHCNPINTYARWSKASITLSIFVNSKNWLISVRLKHSYDMYINTNYCFIPAEIKMFDVYLL